MRIGAFNYIIADSGVVIADAETVHAINSRMTDSIDFFMAGGLDD